MSHKNFVNYSPSSDFINAICGRVDGFNLIKLGLASFSKISGMKRLYLMGVFLTFVFVIVLFTLFIFGIYLPFVAPFVDHYVERLNQIWSWLTFIATPAGWLIKFLSWVILFIVAQKSVSILMGFWLDSLVLKVVCHFRRVEETPFKLVNLFKGLKFSLKNMPFVFVLLLLGFIPIIGTVFAFVGATVSLGFDIKSPYLLVLAERDKEFLDRVKLRRIDSFTTGLVQSSFSFIPLLGWLLQPFFMVLQIIGFVYFCESQWQKSLVQEGSAISKKL